MISNIFVPGLVAIELYDLYIWMALISVGKQ